MVGANSAADTVPEGGRVLMPAALQVDGVYGERSIARSLEARAVEAGMWADEHQVPRRLQDPSCFREKSAPVVNVGVDEGQVDDVDQAVGKGKAAGVAYRNGTKALACESKLFEGQIEAGQ